MASKFTGAFPDYFFIPVEPDIRSMTQLSSEHTFHIPVMGLAYTVDTPVKVARFGISSVVSIIQDELVEQMRELYTKRANENFVPIPDTDIDHRAKRGEADNGLSQPSAKDRRQPGEKNEARAV
jgi:hypothetical protein